MSQAPRTPAVILNLFQDPFRSTHRGAVNQRNCAVALVERAFGPAARWMLKQVQHDEVVREAAE